MSNPQCPNLFDFATKELSQDAMIRRLIRWADHRDIDLPARVGPDHVLLIDA